MSQNRDSERPSLPWQAVGFLLTVATIIVSITLAYGRIDTRLSVLETKVNLLLRANGVLPSVGSAASGQP